MKAIKIYNTNLNNIRLGYNKNIFSGGVRLNGSTSYLERVNTGIVQSTIDEGFMSARIRLEDENDSLFFGAAYENKKQAIVLYPTYAMLMKWQHGQYDYQYRIDYSLNIGQTYHICFNTNSDFTFYLDGISLGSMNLMYSYGSSRTVTPEKITIGREYRQQTLDLTTYYKGIIGDVIFGTSSITETDASKLYNNGNPSNPSFLSSITAWYPLNKDVLDYSGNGMHFTNYADLEFVKM